MVGIIEASTTNKPSNPYTCPRELTTAIESVVLLGIVAYSCCVRLGVVTAFSAGPGAEC
jgi:hypothetical protein